MFEYAISSFLTPHSLPTFAFVASVEKTGTIAYPLSRRCALQTLLAQSLTHYLDAVHCEPYWDNRLAVILSSYTVNLTGALLRLVERLIGF